MSLYIPYPALMPIWKSSSHLSLSLPWITIDLTIDEPEKEWIVEALENLTSNPRHFLVQKFLTNLKDYPISYIAPRAAAEVEELMNTSVVVTQDFASLDLSSPACLVKALNPDQSLKVLEDLSKTWEWSLEDLLKSTRIEGTEKHDPLSVVTYLIGKRLEVESVTADLRANLPLRLDELRQKDEPRFFEIMKLLLCQTHHITAYLHDHAQPAAQAFPHAWEKISEFLAEEEGHDQLMIASLKELGCEDVSSIDLPETIIVIMQLFHQAACHSLLAFTLMVGYFEGVTYEESDPLADVLKKSSKPESARGYDLHHQINQNSNHADFIFQLAAFISYLSRAEVEYAARILELASQLGAISDRYFYDLAIGQNVDKIKFVKGRPWTYP